MNSTALLMVALGMSLSGFLALSLAMDRHYEDSYGRGQDAGKNRAWLRACGGLGLALSLVASLQSHGAAQGWVLWLGVLTVAALMATVVLSYAPRRAAAMGMAGGAVALLAIVVLLIGA